LKIVILTIGTFGDVQPYVALGLGLKQAGYDVTFATHQGFSSFVSGYGLDFVALAGDPQKWAKGVELQSLAEDGRNFRQWMHTLGHLADPLMESILKSCWQASQGANAIIYSPLAWAGYSIAEKLDIPSFAACLQPMTPTRYFPAVWSPRQVKLGKIYNRLTHLFVEQAYWHFNKVYINHWRKESLELTTLPLFGPFSQPRWKSLPFLYGYSPTVNPKPFDWPNNTHITGYWFLPEDKQWRPDGKLLEFLSSGLPPVYIGFGSMPDRHPDQLLKLVTEALNKIGQRAVVQGQWSKYGDNIQSDTIFRIDWVPHSWLFPRMAAIVHHGGASTVANALRAGVPSIVIPFSWDQPFWGERIFELGAGPKPISRGILTTESLKQAIQTCLYDSKIKENASHFGMAIQNEDGVHQAVRIVSCYLKNIC
jgi:sterol 3beta-glucosyltransferase